MPELAMYGIMEEDPGREIELWTEEEGSEDEGEEGGPAPP